jgi:hypothetical protein
LTYFSAYIKQLMQINKLLCIIHKLRKVVYNKTTSGDTNFVSANLRINIKAHWFEKAIFNKLKNKSIQTSPKSWTLMKARSRTIVGAYNYFGY